MWKDFVLFESFPSFINFRFKMILIFLEINKICFRILSKMIKKKFLKVFKNLIKSF